MTTISGASIEKNYIKKHSWSGFKSGVKYSSYLYLGATVASLLISLTVVPIFPFALLAFNPIAWAMLGVAFIVLSGAAMSIASPLFHWAVDEGKKQPESELNKNVEVESPSSLLRDVKVKRQETLRNSNNFVSATMKGDYKKWLLCREIIDIAEKKYRYPNGDNAILFCVVSFYDPNEEVPNPSKKIRERVERVIEEIFGGYRDNIERAERPNRLILTLILNLKNHWITLTIAYDSESKRFRAYHCNPFGGIYNRIDEELLKCLKEGKFFPLREEDIRVNQTRQQKDGYNCGIYALENAKIMTDMMKEGRSFAEIDEKLAGYVHADQRQEEMRVQKKREEFAGVLMDNMSRMSDSEFKQKIQVYERRV